MSDPEADAYLKNLEHLVTARTEQLRAAVTAMEKLTEALEPLRPDIVKQVRDEFDAANIQIAMTS